MDGLEQKILERYTHLSGLLARHFHRSRRGTMMTAYSGQGRVLKFLRSTPEITQRDLARALSVRSQSLGETLLKLEKSGYITRSPSEQDRRTVVVRLTPAGRSAQTEDPPQAGDSPFSCLSPEQQRQLDALLEQVISHLEASEPPERPCRRRRDRP